MAIASYLSNCYPRAFYKDFIDQPLMNAKGTGSRQPDREATPLSPPMNQGGSYLPTLVPPLIRGVRGVMQDLKRCELEVIAMENSGAIAN